MKRSLLATVIIILFLSACRAPEVEPTAQTGQPGSTTATMPSTDTNVSTPNPTPTSTSQPAVSLSICTAELPESLFPYSGPQSAAKANILAMIYPEPFIRTNSGLAPLALQKVPTQADGDLRLVPVSVSQGQSVVDSRGQLVVLKAGVTVRPSGCRDQSCMVTWDGQAPLEMDQMEIDFLFREGLTWSDGTPVSGNDSVFSFALASAPEAPGLKWAEARTERYIANGSSMVQWVGRPGFTTSQISQLFWNPLPAHLFNRAEDWDAVAIDARLAEMPLSYGPYVISNREAGETRFIRNPYFSRSDGLNGPDSIVMRVAEGGASQAWNAMQTGRCDVLDGSFGLEQDPEVIAAVQADGRFGVHTLTNKSWMQLVFGIQPASYDAFYNVANGDRPDILGDANTRQGFAHCLDREAMLPITGRGLGEIWYSFRAPGQSRLALEDVIVQDFALGLQHLVQAGWRDHDNNPATPMQAWEVPGVPVGTLLSVELLITPTAFHRNVSDIIVESLGRCGIEVLTNELPADVLYAPGPSGPLFGREFDLALIAWQPLIVPDCGYYQSWQIPAAENQWIGTNIAGFSNAAFDDACSSAALALPNEFEDAIYQAEKAYQAALPAVPLFSNARVMVVSRSACLPEVLLGSGNLFDRSLIDENADRCP